MPEQRTAWLAALECPPQVQARAPLPRDQSSDSPRQDHRGREREALDAGRHGPSLSEGWAAGQGGGQGQLTEQGLDHSHVLSSQTQSTRRLQVAEK